MQCPPSSLFPARARAVLAVLTVGSLALACNSQPSVNPGQGGNGGAGSGSGGKGGAGGGGASSGNGGAGSLDAFVVPDSPPITADASDDRQCGLQTHDLMKAPPDLMLVLDRSSSMNRLVPGAPPQMNGMPANLWSETLGAVDDVVKNTHMGVQWGLKLFPQPSGCDVADGAEVPIAASNYQPVLDAARTANWNMSGDPGTPTPDAVRKAVAYLRTLTTTNPKYLVLATDGQPTCPGGTASTTMSVAAVTEAAAAGFKTYVIGIALGAGAGEVLNQLATAGGVPRNDPTTKYYPVANRADLVQALTAITGQVTNCVFPLSKTPPVPDNVKVTAGGQTVPRDMNNGWSYTSAQMTAIQFNGQVCEQIKTSMAQVNIVFGCPGVIIP